MQVLDGQKSTHNICFGWKLRNLYRGSYTSDQFRMKFIKQAFGEFDKFNMKWLWV